MFLRERSTQAESLDSHERPVADIAASYRQLARLNRLFFFSHPFVITLPRLLGTETCRSLTLLDVGAGDGLQSWIEGEGRKTKFSSLRVDE